MESSRHVQLSRGLLVLLLLCGWLIATNHCALGLMAPRATEENRSHCAAHPMPENNEPADCPITCCKALQAIQADGAKVAANPGVSTSELWLIWAEALIGSAQTSRPQPELLDTGPPFAFSFAEIVLQRSLLGLAPPLL